MASTSYSQIPSSSTSPPTLWDVFLSFRGKDTRYTFTDHLYHALHRTGIRTFKDDPELCSGEVISDSLIQAIQDSKAYIVVLSENYASSPWCLDELVKILECYKAMQRLVIPVFYYIDPAIVRHQIKSFEEAFEKHQTRFGKEKVDQWRVTLNQVAAFSGHHISETRSQAEIVDKVVERVLLEINPVALNVAKYPVGLDSRVKGVTALFNSDIEAVIKIGIYGMGGVGKTTLAKAVYNLNYRRFQGSCFLANVREVSRTKGVVCLQEQLIADVLKCNNINISCADQGIELIRVRICSKKVLIVIDDLDDPKPLECLEGSFALGSIVIITTRNEDMLDRIKVKAKYKVDRMNEDESYKLFTQHAFGDETISDTFLELSKEILKRAGGLPLALQVFGSNLLSESEDGWRKFINKLKQTPIDDVEENLMISFDALKSLDPFLQDIFLDIACFYIGWEKEEAAKVMETCYTFVNHSIGILKKRSLITINDRDELGMHDLLRDMGRNIARNNSHDEPGKHSRLWVSKDIDNVLKNHKGTEAIQGIFAGYNKYRRNGVTFVAKSFKSMSKLKFLYLNNVNLTGSFKQTFKDLRWLHWTSFPLECLPSDFYAEKLVMLELPRSNMRIWEPPREFKKLKTLNMSGSVQLKETPDFNRLPCLETLNLEHCSSLEEVHVSIGILVNLVHLNLRDCENLRSLPDSICSLRSLEVLNFRSCCRLEALPTKLGSIVSLKMLNASILSVSKLPDSIGRLSNLVELDLGYNNNLKTLPDSICNLRSLEILDVGGCRMLEELPDQLGMITSLRKLNLRDNTMLKMLPDISQLSHIKHLDLNRFYSLLSISELPTNLERINANDCMSLKKLPDLSSLKHLKNLFLTNCVTLEETQGLEELTSLNDLSLHNCKSLQRLPNLCNLGHLKVLDLKHCGNLLSISELPPNLKRIEAEGCTSLKRLPNLSNLKQLRRLDLKNCSGLTEIQGLEELNSLNDLSLYNCKSLQRLPNISNLKQLGNLDLSNCSALTEVQGLEELTSLEKLEFRYCVNLLSVSRLPPNLKWVEAEGCTSLKRLPNLSNLKQLRRLDLKNCSGLTDIQGLEELNSLNDLSLYNCKSLQRLPNLSNLKHLSELELSNCSGLTEIQGLEELTSLEKLEFRYCVNLLSVSRLPPNLKWVEVEGCTSLKRLPNLSNLKQLGNLDLSNCSGLTEIQGLEELTSLENLEFRYCVNLLSVSKLPLNLKRVVAEGCTSLKRLPNLSNLKQLCNLELSNCSGLTDIQGLEELTSLKSLLVAGCGSSLLTCTFTQRFFEVLSGLGHRISISIGQKEFRDWISQPSKDGLVNRSCQDLGIQLQLDLQPNEAHNLLAIILAFADKHYGVFLTVKNMTSGFTWSEYILKEGDSSFIVIVPSSILSIRDGDDRIEITTDVEILCGIHLLYKTEITTISRYCSSIDNVEDERSYPCKRFKHLECGSPSREMGKP